MFSLRPMTFVTTVLALCRLAAADPLEDAMTKLVASEAKVKSCTAKTRMTQELDLGEGNSIKSSSEGTLEWKRKGEKKLFRSETKTTGAQKFSDQEIKLDQTMTMISDGDFYYTVTEDQGQKSAYKQKIDRGMENNPKDIIESMKEQFTLKLLPDEKVEGAECFVIEGLSKDPESDPMTKQVLYFRKDIGMNVKMVTRDKNDKVVMTHTVSDLKLDADIPADRFVFKAPEGVEVIDMTQPVDPGKQP